MKVFKEKQHSFFPRPLGIGSKLYMSVGIMVYYDLNDPENLLTEQELWKEVPAQLGSKPIIDQGVPKPRGEFLVTGSCFAPRGQSRPASEVSISVGEHTKTLNIFGERYWKNGVITKAEPFVEMPVVWANAYGGQDFKKNPLGKGRDKVMMPDGSSAVPLPNVELQQQQIGSPGDSPDPGCYASLDMMWPQRFDKNGTYDKKWQTERWPFFPDDMNYEFFNMACEDQYMEEFFKGGEAVTIKNMNPDIPYIESSLPDLRMRCFISLDTKFKQHTFPVGPLPSNQISENEEFREVSTRLETAWFFPSIMRGLLIYRGTTEIRDEDGLDALRVLVRHESPDEEIKSIEFYRDLQIKLLDRGVDIDMSKAEEAMKKAEKSMLKIKNIPKFADNIRQKALGNRPHMPMPEPEEMLVMSQAQLVEQRATIDKLEAMARKAHAEHGHLINIDLGIFDRFRHKIDSMSKKTEDAVAQLSASKKKIEKDRQSIIKKASAMAKKVSPEELKKAGIDPDEPIPADFPFNKKINPWHDRGFPFVVKSRRALENDRETMKNLTDLGLTRKTVKHYWIGFSSEELNEIPSDWGLEGDESFKVPAGLVFPRFDGAVLNHIKMNPAGFGGGKSVLVDGSDESPLFLTASTLIDLPSMPAAEGAPVVCVGDELQALFMEQEVGDCCSIIAMSGPAVKPGKDAAKEIKTAQAFLVVRPEKWNHDSEFKAEWADWQKSVKIAEPMELPHGKTVFEANKNGCDIRQWVFDHLPKEYAGEHSVSLAMPEKGKTPGPDFLKDLKPKFPDIKALTKGIHAEVKEAMEAKFAPLIAEKESILADMKKRVAKFVHLGLDPEKITMTAPEGAKNSFKKMGDDIAARIRFRVSKLKEAGLISSEQAQQMEAEAAKAEQMGANAESKSAAMHAKLEAKKKELAEGLAKLKAHVPPDSAVEKLKANGIDAEAIRPLTREEVKIRHDQGKVVAGAILSGVDLSDLDLSGIDLSGCQLAKTSFKNAKLDGAKFCKAIGKEADFSGASVVGADFEAAFFGSGKFVGSDLSRTKALQSVFKGADFSKATLRETEFNMAILEKTDFSKADLGAAKIHMCMVSGKADEADFRQSSITKCIFKESSLNNTDFRKAEIHESLFNGTKGEKINFSGANLDKLRTGRNAEFKKADFSGAKLRGAALRESDFSESTFAGADLENALVENSRMVRTNFNGAYAKGARFTKSNLEGATMRAFNLLMGGMRKARLVDTDLRGSNLFAVDFYKAVLGNTRFESANLKRSQLHDRLDLLEED